MANFSNMSDSDGRVDLECMFVISQQRHHNPAYPNDDVAGLSPWLARFTGIGLVAGASDRIDDFGVSLDDLFDEAVV